MKISCSRSVGATEAFQHEYTFCTEDNRFSVNVRPGLVMSRFLGLGLVFQGLGSWVEQRKWVPSEERTQTIMLSGTQLLFRELGVFLH